jgi:hypothetical protein
MVKLLPFLCVVTALLGGHASAFDESLQQSFGKNRVKIQREETPKSVSDSKIQTVKSRYAARMRECREKTERGKQYCMQEADNQLMIDERKIRDAARQAPEE